ncbi:ABC transporter substrate-binding protein [Pendulispora albinea]|uniref:ABC transporter substrate-binding protein n=1 Tax=Pendulispora albinea TaxID=2741071 RepID=A0ABZ2MA96_9BACT
MRTATIRGVLGLAISVLFLDGCPPSFSPSCSGDECVGVDATCKNNVQCNLARGPSWVCRSSTQRCVNLASEDCKRILGDTSHDDAVVVGSVFPVEGSYQLWGKPIENGVELAFDDFLQAGGLPPLPGKTQRRPMVLIACNDGANALTAIRAARHLTEDVGVPAIIGSAYSGVTTEVATKVTIPAKVLLISPSATDPTLSTLADDGLVWRTCPSDVTQASAHAALMKILEPDLKTRLSADKLKVVILHKNNSNGRDLGDALMSVLKFNDATATHPSNGNYFRRAEYVMQGGTNPDPIPAGPGGEWIDELAAFKPHVIFLLGTAETVYSIIPMIEDAWPIVSYRPFYLLTDGSAIPQMANALALAPEARQRMLGTKPGTGGENFKGFVRDYRSRIHDGTSPEATGAVNAYDAFYTLMYAIVALGDKPMTGPNIAGGFSRLIASAPALPSGPAAIHEAFRLLTEGSSFNYEGASGPLDFDMTTGEPHSDIQLWCVREDNNGKITDPITIPAAYFSTTTPNPTGGWPAIRQFCDL